MFVGIFEGTAILVHVYVFMFVSLCACVFLLLKIKVKLVCINFKPPRCLVLHVDDADKN